MVEENFNSDVAKKSEVGKTVLWSLSAFVLGFGIIASIYFMQPRNTVIIAEPTTTVTTPAKVEPATPEEVKTTGLEEACRLFIIAYGKDVQATGTDFSSLYTEASSKTTDVNFQKFLNTVVENYTLTMETAEDQDKVFKYNVALTDAGTYCVDSGIFNQQEYIDFMKEASGIE